MWVRDLLTSLIYQQESTASLCMMRWKITWIISVQHTYTKPFCQLYYLSILITPSHRLSHFIVLHILKVSNNTYTLLIDNLCSLLAPLVPITSTERSSGSSPVSSIIQTPVNINIVFILVSSVATGLLLLLICTVIFIVILVCATIRMKRRNKKGFLVLHYNITVFQFFLQE